jgi:hypothetical protein
LFDPAALFGKRFHPLRLSRLPAGRFAPGRSSEPPAFGCASPACRNRIPSRCHDASCERPRKERMAEDETARNECQGL